MTALWLAGARPGPYGLEIPGLPRRHTADLVLTQEEVQLVVGPLRAHLSWDRYERGWQVVSASNSGSGGIGIRLWDDLLSTHQQLREALRRPFDALSSDFELPAPVVLCRGHHDAAGESAEADTIAALLRVLRDRPAARARLGEPGRVRRLAHELPLCPLRQAPWAMGARRVTVETLAQLQVLGYRHKYSRPVPGDARSDCSQVVEAVLAGLAASPYLEGHTFPADDVAAVVHKYYCDITPWPFGALTVDDRPGEPG